MSLRLRTLTQLFHARLSRRIEIWVFLSIILIEAIILIPSVYRREGELLEQLSEISAAKATGVLTNDEAPLTDQSLLGQFQTLQTNEAVAGGALYRINGQLVGQFGEEPELTFDQVTRRSNPTYLNRSQQRYDAIWDMNPLKDKYVLIIRHDASNVRQELIAFIGRIIGLVLIISLFVSIATMIVLQSLVIEPILQLRRDLLKAGTSLAEDPQGPPPKFDSLTNSRDDELGEVIQAFEQMFHRISDAIAQRQQAEADLRLSEEKFSKAFQASPNPITLSTLKDGQFIEVNDSFLKLFDLAVEEALGHSSLELNLWANPADRTQMIQTLLKEGVIRNDEYRLCDRNGQAKTVLYSSEQLKVNDQDCILAVINDITERKEAEIALEASEERFRTLVDQAVDAIYVVNEQGQFVDVNQQACANLGYTRDELLQCRVPDIQKSLSDDDFTQLWQRLLPKDPLTFIGTHQRKDGSQFPVEVRLGIFEAGEEPLLLALARDITERQQAEKDRERLAEIGELAAMIVHEVRNPLTTVLMGLGSFQRMDLPERAQLRLQLALDESERLQRLLNEILLFAKQHKLNTTTIELNQFFADLLPTLQEMPSAENRPIQLTPASESAWVAADIDKLKQVFINLVSNACEAVSQGEPITWHVQLTPLHNQVTIAVNNGGDPIPAEVLPQLTKPFFTTKSSGNGLGLAITKRIVEAHNGELQIQSTAAAGTTVTVSFPTVSISSAG
ncbi:PAS domain S-box protein [Acaryochloris sp. IP29b_bin.148]|uniref:PAS domain S-box protein n=1 Tax=Acaryochloris sp. IP29b_bin.148 TaxID=2969218 RepID=UPI00262895E3|nr:PAS domain S-box protein [Acaryochloris sp. IP29b_bin.148]